MGTDIHFFAEKRNPETGQWEFLPAPSDGYDHRDADRIEKEGGSREDYKPPHPYRFVSTATIKNGYETWEGEDEKYLRDWFDDRNYRLFGMLADVRNGYGVAGVKTGEPLPVIAEPREWPEDLSPELEAESHLIEHTPSWLTVAEMQAYFDRMRGSEILINGCITGLQYEQLRDKGVKPDAWSGGIFGPDIMTVSPAAYDKMKGLEHDEQAEDLFGRRQGQTTTNAGTQVYVDAEWRRPFAEFTERFEDCLREMVAVAEATPENIRAVFYFDS